jgi:hypothetical protein
MGHFPGHTRQGHWLALSLWAVAASVWVSPLQADSSEVLKDRFFREAPSAWEEYRLFAARLQGTVDTTKTVNGQTSATRQLEYKSNSACKLVVAQERPPEGTVGRVHAFNAVYGFTLSRRSSDAPWVMENLLTGDKRYDRDEWEVNRWPNLLVCIHPWIASLPDLIRQPTFRVLKASAVHQGGRELVQIDFDNTHPWPTDGTRPLPIQGGSLVLDPDRLWTLGGCTLQNKYPRVDTTVRGEYELRDPSAKYSVPRRFMIVQEEHAPGRGERRTTRLVWDYDLKEVSRLPGDEEFTLTAFGLPEPAGLPGAGRSAPWHLWFGLAAFAGLALAVGCRRAARYYRVKAEKARAAKA